MNRHTAVTIIQKLVSSDIYGAINEIIKSVELDSRPLSNGIVLPDIFVQTCINKIAFIKTVQSVTGWNLVDAKNAVDNKVFCGSAAQWMEICRRQNEWVAVPQV